MQFNIRLHSKDIKINYLLKTILKYPLALYINTSIMLKCNRKYSLVQISSVNNI